MGVSSQTPGEESRAPSVLVLTSTMRANVQLSQKKKFTDTCDHSTSNPIYLNIISKKLKEQIKCCGQSLFEEKENN